MICGRWGLPLPRPIPLFFVSKKSAFRCALDSTQPCSSAGIAGVSSVLSRPGGLLLPRPNPLFFVSEKSAFRRAWDCGCKQHVV